MSYRINLNVCWLQCSVSCPSPRPMSNNRYVMSGPGLYMFHYAVHCAVRCWWRCGELVAGGYVGLWSENSETVTVTPHQVQVPCLRRSVCVSRTQDQAGGEVMFWLLRYLMFEIICLHGLVVSSEVVFHLLPAEYRQLTDWQKHCLIQFSVT